ncbi:MAG: beta-lactamase family protein [Actinomycetia bacterium]|nr:beta-lactamase family protein [Actinomycetes bacterium]
MKSTTGSTRGLWVALTCAALFVASCGNSDAVDANPTVSAVAIESTTTTTILPATTTSLKVYAATAFDQTDALMTERVNSAGLSGGMVRIGRADGSVIYEKSIGAVRGSTPLSVASSTKWLPEFSNDAPPVTPRQLLSHTSGVRDNKCQAGGMSLSACVKAIASSARQFPAGSKFSYGNSDFLVIGRLVEILGGADFATIVNRRITGPLQMNATTWPGAPSMANAAFGVRVTIDDYGKFLQMVLNRGETSGTRVLSGQAVDALISNQVSAYDTTNDFAVGITKIPRYGLGGWPDVVNEFGGTVVASGNGAMGFYPWVDYATNTWGIIGVQDARGAPVAVPASQKVAVEARNALSR